MAKIGCDNADDRGLLLSRFREFGIDDFNELEMLKMILFFVLPRRYVNSAADSLIRKFGSLKNILYAPISELKKIEGLEEYSARRLSFPGDLIDYLNSSPRIKESLASLGDILAYFINYFKDKTCEVLTLLLLGKRDVVLDVHDITNNMPNQILPGSREIAEQIMKFDCRKVIIAHNHLTGTAAPSDNDLLFTRKLGRFLEKIGVELADHIIVCRDEALSLRESGYLEKLD